MLKQLSRPTHHAIAALASLMLVANGCAKDATNAIGNADVHESRSATLAVISQIRDTELRDFIQTLATAAEPGDPNDLGRLAMAFDANGFDTAAELIYRQTSTAAPANARWRYLLANRLHKNGKLDEAIAQAQEAAAHNPGYAPIHMRLGDWQLERHDIAEARVAYEMAKTLGAGPAAELGIAQAALKSNDFRDVVERLNGLVTNTQHPVALRLLSDAWRALGDESKARQLLTNAAQSRGVWFDDPWLTQVREYARGKGARLHDVELMLGSGLTEDALLVLEKLATGAAPDFNVEYHFALAYFQAQKFVLAKRHLEAAIQLEPIHYPSHLLLASLYQRDDDNGGAVAHLQHVVRIYPTLQIAHQELGFVQLRLGDTSGAFESFKTAIALDSVAPNVHYYSGVILGERGMCREAIEHFETTLTLDPAHERARLGLQTCEQFLLNRTSR